MPAPTQPPPPRGDSKDYRIRPLKRGDRDAVFRLVAAEGATVPEAEQETTISWVVQHPELESLVAHDVASFTKLLGLISLSHRPVLRFGGRVASVDAFVLAPEGRGKGVAADLLAQSLRRAYALACKRMEIVLPTEPDERHELLAKVGFRELVPGHYVLDGAALTAAMKR